MFKTSRSAIGAVLSIISLPLITRSLGAEQYGIFNFLKIFFEKIIQFFDIGTAAFYPKLSKQWGTRFEDLKPAIIEEDLFNQLGGAILFSQRMIRHFRQQEYGNLLHISSIQGVATPKFDHYEGTDMVSPIEYSAIKAGVISITRYLAKYCKNQNIRVNCISPGGILDKQPESFLKKYRSSCQIKGLLDASDITGALIFLLSEQSKFVTGQNIIVDDGWTI